MKSSRFFRRVLCLICVSVLLISTTALKCSPVQTICVSAPEVKGGGLRADDVRSVVSSTVGAIPYVADAALNELNGIVTYACGGDPCEGKSIDEAGQNTKNNVAVSLLWARKELRHARTVRFVLEPYNGSDSIFEVCAYIRRGMNHDEECVRTGFLHNRETRRITTVDGTGMMGIGYDFDYTFRSFSAASDPWQRNFGFCRMYDGAAFLIGDVYETIRVPFRYGDKDWMIQIWKGIYSWNMLGGEVGLYNKPLDRAEAFYDCATDPERLEMDFSVSLEDETIVQTESALSWWQTAFTVHRIAKPSSLTMTLSLTFPDTQMLHAFRSSLLQVQPDVQIRQGGLTLHIVWPGK